MKGFTPDIPAQDAPIGLLKGSPIVTSWTDERGVSHPSILAQSVAGHLVERIEGVNVTTTETTITPQTVHIPPTFDPDGPNCIHNGICTIPVGGGTDMTTHTARIETRTNFWRWIDHGVPKWPGGGVPGFARGTIVDSLPAIAYDSKGPTVKRLIYIRGLDGHLWKLDSSDEIWRDLGFPGKYPLVGSPSLLTGDVDGHTTHWIFMLNAGGELNFFTDVDQPSAGWTEVGPVGAENCFGTPGMVGGGSPKAISFWSDQDQRRHKQVFMVGGLGDLYSWHDGFWEELFDVQYSIPANSILPWWVQDQYVGCGPFDTPGHGCPLSLRVCGNAPLDVQPTPPGPDPNNPASINAPDLSGNNAPDGSPNNFIPYLSRPRASNRGAIGTPDAVVYYLDGVLRRTIVVLSGRAAWPNTRSAAMIRWCPRARYTSHPVTGRPGSRSEISASTRPATKT